MDKENDMAHMLRLEEYLLGCLLNAKVGRQAEWQMYWL